MHIPDLMLQGPVCFAAGAISVAGVTAAVCAAYKTKNPPSASFFAGVTTLIFAAQMADFAIPFGTTGHLIGAALAVALLGSAFGVLSMYLVILTQCFLFADGGLGSLGANVINMALLAALPAIVVRECLATALSQTALLQKFQKTAYFVAAFAGVLLAAAACAVQLALSGVVPIQNVLPAMLSAHLLVGITEAGLTVFLLVVLSSAAKSEVSHRAWGIPLGLAAVVALLISPFAATAPGGLESVAAALDFEHLLHLAHSSGAQFAAPFADYAVTAIPSETLSTALAGFIGVCLIFVFAYGARRVFVYQEKA